MKDEEDAQIKNQLTNDALNASHNDVSMAVSSTNESQIKTDSETAEEAVPTSTCNLAVRQVKRKSKTIRVVVLVLALILVGAGIAMGILLINGWPWKDNSNHNAGQNTEQEENNNGTAEEGEVALDVNSDFVQELIKPFLLDSSYIVLGTVNGAYTDDGMKEGQPSDDMMLKFALINMKQTACKMPKNALNLEKRYEEYTKELNKSPVYAETGYDKWQAFYGLLYDDGCYDMQKVRELIKQMFGVDFVASEVFGTYQFFGYSADYDELYMAADALGGVGYSIMHDLNKATMGDGVVYIYESKMSYMDGEFFDGCEWKDTGEVCEIRESAMDVEDITDDERDYEAKMRKYFEEHKGNYPEYRWTFKMIDDGHYVFGGLERVR